MKTLILLGLVLLYVSVVQSIGLRRKCECEAISPSMHVEYKSWDLSTCHWCGCDDAAMKNCRSSCESMVSNYAKTGCGIIPKGSKIRYKWKASSCSKGISEEEFICQ